MGRMRIGRAVLWAVVITALAWWMLPPLMKRTAPRFREAIVW